MDKFDIDLGGGGDGMDGGPSVKRRKLTPARPRHKTILHKSTGKSKIIAAPVPPALLRREVQKFSGKSLKPVSSSSSSSSSSTVATGPLTTWKTSSSVNNTPKNEFNPCGCITFNKLSLRTWCMAISAILILAGLLVLTELRTEQDQEKCELDFNQLCLSAKKRKPFSRSRDFLAYCNRHNPTEECESNINTHNLCVYLFAIFSVSGGGFLTFTIKYRFSPGALICTGYLTIANMVYIFLWTFRYYLDAPGNIRKYRSQSTLALVYFANAGLVFIIYVYFSTCVIAFFIQLRNNKDGGDQKKLEANLPDDKEEAIEDSRIVSKAF